MLHIRRDGSKSSVTAPDEFFDPDYIFGAERIKRIKERSGLSWDEFSAALGLRPSVVTAWIANRHEKHTNNPSPSARLRLAFIEAEQLRHMTKEKA